MAGGASATASGCVSGWVGGWVGSCCQLIAAFFFPLIVGDLGRVGAEVAHSQSAFTSFHLSVVCQSVSQPVSQSVSQSVSQWREL